jgi:hypothetical protein
LLAFHFNDQAILTVSKNRESRRGGSRWANNVYQLRPITGFAIFDESKSVAALKSPENDGKSSVSPKGDIQLGPVSMSPSVSPYRGDTREGDTNQTQEELTRRLNVNDLEKAVLERGERQQTISDSEFRATLERRMLITDILNVCGDRHSRGFYNIVVQKVPAELVRAALSETKHRGATGQIKKSKGAFFTDEIQRLARERGIDLGLNRQTRDEKAASSP